MTFKTIAAIVILATATVWAQDTPATQSSAPVTAPAGNPFTTMGHGAAGRRGMSSFPRNKMSGASTPATMRQRIQDMESTLAKMHALLEQMRAKTAKSGAKDSLAKANIDMWELMVGQLDKQFAELRAAALAREELDARRAAMYKQADAKAAAAAQAAQSSSAGQATNAGQGAGQGAAGQSAPGQTSSAPPANPSSSPN